MKTRGVHPVLFAKPLPILQTTTSLSLKPKCSGMPPGIREVGVPAQGVEAGEGVLWLEIDLPPGLSPEAWRRRGVLCTWGRHSLGEWHSEQGLRHLMGLVSS